MGPKWSHVFPLRPIKFVLIAYEKLNCLNSFFCFTLHLNRHKKFWLHRIVALINVQNRFSLHQISAVQIAVSPPKVQTPAAAAEVSFDYVVQAKQHLTVTKASSVSANSRSAAFNGNTF